MTEPDHPIPDAKDWTVVLREPCPECGFNADGIDVTMLSSLVLTATSSWPEVLARVDARTRPAPGVWSPLEYGAHVRELLEVFNSRIDLVRNQDSPTFPNWDQDQAAITGQYWQADPSEVAAGIQQAAHANSQRWAEVTESEWGRTGRRGDGVEFTLANLGRYLLHDLIHHLHDVDAI